ncbi:MAG: hypothetical protein BV456_09085 [Thermoplasmata archaeon M8B2D]|nr:MAG: hypothetical protein BV456_09085 [Thermoplasmata archaeon M8B2D]
MKIQIECVPCLLKRIVFESEQSTNDKKIQQKTLKKTLTLLADLYDPNGCSASIATNIHRVAYDTLGDEDPYKDLKKQSNKIAKKLVPRVEELVFVSEDPIRMIMLCSIVGNMMDFGIRGGSKNPNDLSDIFEGIISEDLGWDDVDKVKKILSKSKNVILFTDNCGEIVFDKILCREIKKFNPDIFLTLVVKGERILSDATMEDAKELGMDKVVDEILTTGCFAVGVDFDRLPSDVEKKLKSSDLIICKGMANYESFSETNYRPIAYLLRTKCSAIADSMGLPIDICAVKLYR